ncbi:Pycsar system effector family protein [Paenisporosarcina antarctica]|uniref:Pycsar effector protein domain-containing protein n=1 Tax=Paenisporosarcina antarctica TaxID=417367 RepID=A0A4P7A2P9_9BACL|nr:Pycsar system effector family protein [Paenisporosarcina antarctica]QBP43172.1 hypothetical protein E2636_18610 [Paenisporosarcina antarctica]
MVILNFGMEWYINLNPIRENTERLFDYHKHNLVYIGDYIKFADGKAGVALGATLVMLGFFGKAAKEQGFNNLSFNQFGLLLGLIPLVLACYFFIWRVLWPRYTTDSNLYMSWGGIGSFTSSDIYVNFLGRVVDEDFLRAMGRQNYSLAQVCVKKYKYLKFGFTWLTIGMIFEGVFWFVG